MTTYKVAELSDALLDAAVAKAEGLKWRRAWSDERDLEACHVRSEDHGIPCEVIYEPSTNWSDGGPLIEREMISVGYCGDDNGYWPRQWFAQYDDDAPQNFHSVGPTPLIAAMRAYVCAKLGEEVTL